MVFVVVRISIVLALELAGIGASAQNAPQPPQIHVSTHLVQIGVIVRDKNGAVADLTKEDFGIFDRGKPQTISVFTVESPAATRQPTPTQHLPPNTFSDLPQTNDAAVRSITIVLLDNLNTLYGSAATIYEETPRWMEDHALANAKAHLLEYLKGLAPQDRVAVYGLSDTLHVLCDFTSDRTQLLAIVQNYDARSRTSREVVEPGAVHLPDQPTGGVPPPIDADRIRLAAVTNTSRATTTLAALEAIADHVANIPGRKNLVWLSANLPFSSEAMAAILSPAQIAAYPVDGRGLLSRSSLVDENDTPMGELGLPSMMKQTHGSASSDEPPGIDTMRRLAELTGGRAFVNSNDLTGAIRDAVGDSAVTYTLGFYIDANSLDGRFHELKVRVKRSGLSVRYPQSYLALKEAPATQEERRNSFLRAIRSPLDSSAIPLTIRVERVNQPTPNSIALSGSIGIHDLQLVRSGEIHAGALDITVIEQDETGKVLHESTNRINLRFSEKQYPAILKTGVSFRKSVQPQAGATTLRILVQDPSSGEIGSLIIP
ncbi:MAG TPA: VWA domain-containing protein, partial [Candidatus Acidoferrum sp.]